MKIAYSPQGYRIIGTYESIPGVAFATVYQGENGKAEIEHEGETDVNWDGQETVKVMGERCYVDEENNLVTESCLVWREENEDE